MTVQYKVLGQAAPAANAVAILYGVGPNRMAISSTLVVCNTSETDVARYTVEVSPDGSASKIEHRQFSAVSLAPSATECITIGMTLQSGAVVRIKSDKGAIAFTLHGQELTP